MKRSISALLIWGALSLVTAGAAQAQDKTIKFGAPNDNWGLIHSLRHHNVIEREG
jgi:hypothetical protein